jgi:hypothetical protein
VATIRHIGKKSPKLKPVADLGKIKPTALSKGGRDDIANPPTLRELVTAFRDRLNDDFLNSVVDAQWVAGKLSEMLEKSK